MPTSTVERRAPEQEIVADQPRVDWFGNEDTYDGMGYDEYVAYVPSRADFRPYPTPVMYWEVKHPGCAIHPYPTMGQFRSLDEGVWVCLNKAIEDAVREYLQLEYHRNPDDFKLTPDEMQTMKSRRQGTVRYCQSCAFMTCNMEMANLHEAETDHITRDRPRNLSAAPQQE